jgi:hypothetical protein
MSRTRKRPLDSAMVAALVAVAGWAVIIALAAFAAQGLGAAAQVALGGLLAILNLAAFTVIGRGVLARGANRRLWGVLATMKFLLLFGGIFLLLRSGALSLIALAIGYAALPVGIVTASLLGRSDPAPDEGGDQSRDLVSASRPEATPESRE